MIRYRVLDRLGAGTGGTVYRALDLELKREVAVKVMPPGAVASAELQARWRREVRLLSNLSHPNIVRVYEPLEVEGAPAYSMEIVPGRSLAELLEEDGPQPLPVALDIARQAADALAYLHAQSMCHRDIKPANMMMQDDGRLRVMDFGLARDLEGTVLTAQGVGLGTPRYMPPESMTGGAAGPEGDVYALALVLHELITGRAAFDQPRLDSLVDAVLNGEAPSLKTVDGIPRWLLAIQERATAKLASARPTMAEYLAALKRKPLSGRVGDVTRLNPDGAAAAEGPATPRTMPASRRGVASTGGGPSSAGVASSAGAASAAARLSRHRQIAAGTIAGLACVIGVALVAWRRGPPAPPPPVALLQEARPVLPRALDVRLAGVLPPGAQVRADVAGHPSRTVPAGDALRFDDLPPETDVTLTLVQPDASRNVELIALRTPALAPVANLACLPTDRDVLIDFDAPPSAELVVQVRRAGDGVVVGERKLARGAGVFHSVFDQLQADTEYLLSAHTSDGWPGLAPYPFRTRGAQHVSTMKELSAHAKDDPSVEEYAVGLAGMWPDTRSIPLLRRILLLRRERAVSASRAIARAVEVFRDRELVDLLGKYLEAPQPDPARAATLRAVALARHPQAATFGRKFIDGSDFGVLEGAALCLAGTKNPADVDAIARAAEKFPGWSAFVWPMVRSSPGQARTWFKRWLDATTPAAVMHYPAIHGLTVLRSAEDVEALRARLNGPLRAPWEATLQEHLARALGEIGTVDDAPVEAAALALEEFGRAHPTDARPVWALARIRRSASRPAFEAALRASDPQLRRAGIAGLVRLQDRSHLAELRGLLTDPAPATADLAAWALARLEDRDGIPALLARARSTADTRGVAVWALAQLDAPQANALIPELERLAANPGAEPPPRLLALALAAVALRWPVQPLVTALASNAAVNAPFRDALKAALSRQGAGTRGGLDAIPLLPWEPSGRHVYPGDVLVFGLTGTWRHGARPFVRVNVQHRVNPDCAPLAMVLSLGDWKPRLGASPAPLLPALAGELGVSPLDGDALSSCSELLDGCEGAVHLTPR